MEITVTRILPRDKVVEITPLCTKITTGKISLEFWRDEGYTFVTVVGATVYPPCFDLDDRHLLKNERFREEAEKLGLPAAKLHSLIGHNIPFNY